MKCFEFDAETDKIHCDLYTDFESNEFKHLFSPTRRGEDGVDFDRNEVIAEINSALTKKDIRPKAYDRISGAKILIDSGACLSCWPRARFKNAQCDPSRTLVAVNGTHIKTYGTRAIQIKLGNVTFVHPFVLSDLDSPVLGFDFMVDHKLDLLWRKGRPTLKTGRNSIPLTMGRCDSQHWLSNSFIEFFLLNHSLFRNAREYTHSSLID